MIRTLRQREPKAVVVDAGDMFQGTPLYTRYHGEVEVELLNKIGYDIFTIGNHEFDDGPDNLVKQLKRAQFQIINCNMDCSQEKDLQSLIKPFVVRDIDGQRIAFIGAITPELNQVALKTGGVKLKATGADWKKPIEETIAEVKRNGINKIVLVTHVGVELEKELATLPDVDVIIGGHSHTRLEEPIIIAHPDGSHALVVQTGCFTRALGRLAITFDNEGRVRVPETEYRLINITDKVFEDKDLKAYVDEKLVPLLDLRTTFISTATRAFDNNFRTSPNDTALGDIVCDALAEEGKRYGAQIAFENRGGIRGRIEPGPVSLEKVEEILPFDNRAVFATIDGACLLNTLEHSVESGLGGRFLDQHGLKIAYDQQRPKGNRIIFALVQNGDRWQKIKPNDKYRIVINDYSFGGGEGYDFKCATHVQRSEERLSAAFVRYLKAHPTISPDHGDRIIAVRENMLTLESVTSTTSDAATTATTSSISKCGSRSSIQATFSNPYQRGQVLLYAGSAPGITILPNGLSVPLADPVLTGKGRTTSDGTCTIPIAVDDKSRKYVAAIFHATSSGGSRASNSQNSRASNNLGTRQPTSKQQLPKTLVTAPVALPN